MLFVCFGYGQDVYQYDFNSLTKGGLNGQDDWKTIVQTNGTADFYIDAPVSGLTSPDGTPAVFYSAGGPGYGRTATRKATPNFNFGFTQGGVVEMEIDMHRNGWGVFFGAGFDADGDGYIAPGLDTEPNDGGIMVFIQSTNNYVALPDGNKVTFSDIDNAGWARYKIVIDFDAYRGQGSVSLSYKPGTTSQNWVAVNEIQGINMGMTPGSGNKRDYHVWDGIFFHSQGAVGAYDNILIRMPQKTLKTQEIILTGVDKKFTTSPPFAIQVSATSGLPVSLEITEGPATIIGNMVTLKGTAGNVTIKASQAGNVIWSAAPDVYTTFEVADPFLSVFPADRDEITIQVAPNPTTGTVKLIDGKIFPAGAFVKIYNSTGVLKGQFFWNGTDYSLNFAHFAKGLYILDIKSSSSHVIKKLLLN